LVGVGHGPWAWQITGREFHNLETSRTKQIIHFSVKVTTAADVFPCWRQSVLPSRDLRISGAAMLDEDQVPVSFENTPHLL